MRNLSTASVSLIPNRRADDRSVINPEARHQLRQALARDSQFRRCTNAMASRAHECGADKPLLERPPRVLEARGIRQTLVDKLRTQCRWRHDASFAPYAPPATPGHSAAPVRCPASHSEQAPRASPARASPGCRPALSPRARSVRPAPGCRPAAPAGAAPRSARHPDDTRGRGGTVRRRLPGAGRGSSPRRCGRRSAATPCRRRGAARLLESRAAPLLAHAATARRSRRAGSVPPCASSKTPVRSPTAPVNAPRAWPNSSDSTRSSGRAAQFSVQSVRCRRGPDRWSALATSSFPLPLSPSINTAKGAGAARSTPRRTSAIPALVPSRSAIAGTDRRRTRISAPDTTGATAAATVVINAVADVKSCGVPIVQRTTSAPTISPPDRTGAPASTRSPQRCGANVTPAAIVRAAIARSIRPPSAATLVRAPPSSTTNAAPAACNRVRSRRHTSVNTARSSSDA